MLNYSRALRNDVFDQRASCMPSNSSSVWGNNGDIFTLYKHWLCNISAPNRRLTCFSQYTANILFPHYITLAAPFFVLSPIASFISHQLKTEPATLDLNFLPPDISRPKNLDKTRCPISALSVHWFQNLKPFCSQMRNDVASFIINVATFSRQSLPNCDAKPALPCLGLPCTRKKINLWDSSSPASGNERFFNSVNDLLSLQHLSLLGQNFYTPPTNMHCHQPVSAYFSCLSNRW